MEYQYIDMYQEIPISSLDEIYQIIQEDKKFYNLPRLLGRDNTVNVCYIIRSLTSNNGISP